MSAKTFFKGRIISRHSVMLNQNVVPTREITRLCSKKKKKCDPQPGEKLFNGNIPPRSIMLTFGRKIMLMFGRNQHNSLKHLSFN